MYIYACAWELKKARGREWFSKCKLGNGLNILLSCGPKINKKDGLNNFQFVKMWAKI